MYLLKIKHSSDIDVFLQIRDENFALRAYTRLAKDKGLPFVMKTEKEQKELEKIVEEMPYWEIIKI
jgi:hypothetical protein